MVNSVQDGDYYCVLETAPSTWTLLLPHYCHRILIRTVFRVPPILYHLLDLTCNICVEFANGGHCSVLPLQRSGRQRYHILSTFSFGYSSIAPAYAFPRLLSFIDFDPRLDLIIPRSSSLPPCTMH